MQPRRARARDVEPTSDGEINSVGRSEPEGDGVLDPVDVDGAEEDTLPAGHRKRKRKIQKEDVEDVYMQRLAREEAREDAVRQQERSAKRRRTDAEDGIEKTMGESDAEEDEAEASDGSPAIEDTPQHESLSQPKDNAEVEKAARTIFVSNVSTLAITSKSTKKALLAHLSTHLPSLTSPADNHTPQHKIESIRFRSVAFSTPVPKKAAFAKKELMDSTTKSTNAYVVYSTALAAREAARRLNGTVILDRHIHVDEVAHPAKIDHRRCIFVGNLGFVDDETNVNDAEEGNRKRKHKQPGDAEEGLWRTFSKCGTVESVRVPRDAKTRVGKGFAYVQFKDENAVEAALLYNDKRFPPMLPRKLRVVRAKAEKRNKKVTGSGGRVVKEASDAAATGYKRKMTGQEQSLRGRAAKLFGRAGAAQVQRTPRSADGVGIRQSVHKKENSTSTSTSSVAPTLKAPESFVFEGHRASSKQGKSGLKFGSKGAGKGKKKKAGKPATRSAKRGAAWKTKAGK